MKYLRIAVLSLSLFVTLFRGQDAAAAVDTVVAINSVWKYLDDGTDPGPDWFNPSFGDSAWFSGPAELGYGDGDEATVVRGTNLLSERIITTYFRHEFNLANPPAYVLGQMRVRRDDGVIIYLNGVEIYRNTMPAGPVNYLTRATTSVGDENAYLPANVDPGLLVAGRNVVAAEIHQPNLTSSDISFAFELTASDQNATPAVAMISPTENTFYTEPATIAISASASDSDGSVALVEFFQGVAKIGEDNAAPFTLSWSGVLQGSYALLAVATDNLGAKATSAVVNVTVGVATPPTVFSKSPALGNLSSLTSISVSFTDPVFGVSASDLLINGIAATGVSGSGSNYTFTFSQPAEGTVYVGWSGAHGITDFESPPKAFDPFSAGGTWQYTLADTVAPVVTTISPASGATVRQLTSIEVGFSEPVFGVEAADLRVNGLPATSVSGKGNGPYTFQFTAPANGAVTVAWAAGHGITDGAAARNAFAGGSWSYTLNTNAVWSGNIVISEIMFHPSSELVADEWIELRNRGTNAVNLAGWKLNRAVDFVFPSVNLPVGGYLVVAANVAAFNAKYPGVTSVVGGWLGRLSNSRDEIELEDPSGNQVNLVAYADEGDWAFRSAAGGLGWDWICPADGFGSSLELRQISLPNGNGQNWASSITVNGTPGAVNSVAVANLPPMILDVTHFPAVPRSTNNVTILARLVDESATDLAVTLWYRDATTLPAFTSVAMLDNGLSNDGTAGDGIYGVVLPPQANGTITEFYVEAVDTFSNTRTWPAAADIGGGTFVQDANAMFQVDDDAYSGKQAIYRMVMRAGDLSELNSRTDQAGGRTKRNVTLITIEGGDEQIRYNCATRRRGASSFGRNPPTMKFDIPADRAWNNKTSFNLNSDHTYAQVLGAAISLKAGLPTPYAHAVQLRFNGVNQSQSGDSMYGSYAHLESADGEWARDHFPEDGNGNVYNKRRPECALEYRGTDTVAYLNCSYSKESNGSENDWSDLANLLFALDPDTTPADQYVQAVRRNANVELWMRYFAVLYLMDYNETALSNGADDDYDMYRGILDPRFIIVSHDFDSIFGSSGGSPGSDIFLAAARIPNVSRFLHHPDFEPLYFAEYRHQLAGLFNTNSLFPLMDQVLGEWVPAGTIQTMKDVAVGRMNAALAALPAASAVVRATISGEPDSPTYMNSAALNVGGADITQYRYRVNGGAWSADRLVSQPISLSGLANGHYTVYVVGRNSAGTWQADADATVSKTWAVLSSLRGVVINEVLARNESAANHEGTTPDYIELYNSGAASIDLSGLRLTDDLDDPNKYTIPAGTTLAAGAYRVLFANNQDATSGLHIGFGIDGDGDNVYLVDRATNGARVIDSVKFGWQLANLSIGRQTNGQWGLCVPTVGAANVSSATGSQTTLRINEWLATPGGAFFEDFVELYNPDALPVNLGGLWMTDLPIGQPFLHQIAPLSFVDGYGYRPFVADGNKSGGPNHLDFSLSGEVGEIALVAGDGAMIDCVIYGLQFAGVSQGRSPNGGTRIAYFDVPTPGAGNPVAPIPVGPLLVNILPLDHTWKYEASSTDLGTTWRESAFNDTGWLTGQALIGFENGDVPVEPIRTLLTGINGRVTTYFRTTFNLPNGVNISGVEISHVIDDGAVFYVNGTEVGRFAMPAGDVVFGTIASSTVNATLVGGLAVPLNLLQPNGNVIAIELHQNNLNSADQLFGLKLDAVVITNNPGQAGIKINEVLANARNATNSDGTVSDWIELFNPSNGSVDLSGMSLTDQLTTPRRWVFPAGSVIAAGGYRMVKFDTDSPATTNAAATLNTGFGLKASGDSIYLFNRPQSGGELLDAISFGIQASDWSIGRVPSNGTNWLLNVPTQGAQNIAASLGNRTALRLNEWMAAPLSGGDWFEIYNASVQPVELSGLHLTDDLTDRLKYPAFPARSYISAGLSGFLKIIADNTPAAGADHVPFALSKSGESLGIVDPLGTLIDQITFAGQFNGVSQGRLPDGSTNIALFTETQSPEESNYLPIPNVVNNEVLTHSDPPLEDAIELHNTSASAVNISGWYLSEARTLLRKFRIPNGTTIPANGLRVFYETNFNPIPLDPGSFSLSSAKGDEVYLSVADANNILTGYRTVVSFGAAANGVSFGRYITSGLNAGKVEFTAMAQRTFGVDNPPTLDDFRAGTGKTNSGPLVGPVVISEVHYHPVDLIGGVDNLADEFVEIRNITGAAVPLYDPAYPTNVWRLRDAVSFRFPPNASIPANGIIVIVGFNPTNTALLNAFKTKFSVQAGAVILGPFDGKLDNSTDSVELARPDAPQATGSDAGLVPFILVDKVKYLDLTPWPVAADGAGQSLTRVTLGNYGNDPVNWTGATPTPGPQGANPDTDGDGMDDAWENLYFGNLSRTGSADSDGDGMTDLQEFLGGTNPTSAASSLRLQIISANPSVLQFVTATNKAYTVEFKNTFGETSWTFLQSVPGGAARTVRVTNSMAGTTNRFYRVRTP